MLTFGTKSETLAVLEGKLEYASVLPQFCITAKNWKSAQNKLSGLHGDLPDWFDSTLIVRSSAQAEDSLEESLAGHFVSVANVQGNKELEQAMNKVYDSFHGDNLQDQILIQPMLQGVAKSGVVFSRDPNNGGHYYIINYDESSGETNTVTDGSSNDLKVFVHAKNNNLHTRGWLKKLVLLVDELEQKFNHDSLDIEFAVTQNGQVYLLQVRPLIIKVTDQMTASEQYQVLMEVESRFNSLSRPHPYLLGKRSVYGVMPDWNPAEIIGIKPRPLALSLYKELVTDSVWVYQRDNYGYRNLRSFPLLINFSGLPYIDVRVSFNSFIPEDLEDGLADKLVNYYTDQLINNPNNHDKVEFEIIYSSYTLDLPERILELKQAGFSQQDCDVIQKSLRRLTNNIIHDEKGLWRQDIAKLDELKERQNNINSSSLTTTEKIYWLLEHCKRYGTLPFAGLARAGFIAVQLLRSLVSVDVITKDEYEKFMASLSTISSNMALDLNHLSKQKFLEKYGHLRPGTYDILSSRYNEAPDLYFDWSSVGSTESVESTAPAFDLSSETENHLETLLKEHGLVHDVSSFFSFIKGAIEGREYAKFIFTKSLSDALVLIRQLGEEQGFDLDSISYSDIKSIQKLYSSTASAKQELGVSIQGGRENYAKTSTLTLPPLITCSEDIWSFELPKNDPNFVTLKGIIAKVVTVDSDQKELANNILLIPSADPGYDWIFSHGIGGFITMYGGANSHMAIRAAELSIPAVIGAGEVLYTKWSKANMLEIDCMNRQVRVLQ